MFFCAFVDEEFSLKKFLVAAQKKFKIYFLWDANGYMRNAPSLRSKNRKQQENS